jgi:hypothetical protein
MIVAPFITAYAKAGESVWHDNDECEIGQHIDKRVGFPPGVSRGYAHCDRCKALNEEEAAATLAAADGPPPKPEPGSAAGMLKGDEGSTEDGQPSPDEPTHKA